MNILAKLYEHNHWANLELIRACAALRDDQLDARPHSARQWSIRENLVHLVSWQLDYLNFFTPSPAADGGSAPSFAELEASARSSGEGFLALVLDEDETAKSLETPLKTSDGYRIEPWVVFVQALNHATEHRKQIAHLMRLLGVEPPGLDGWGFGEATKAVVPFSR
jgi:uncharacterized damage-inducible protein DinB